MAVGIANGPALVESRAASWLATPAGGVALLITSTFLARLLFASWLGLGIDESYMVAAGREFRLGYFDHPPIAWWLSSAAAHLADSDSAVVVRLPFILLFGLSSWLMYRLGTDLFNSCAGLWSAVLLNAAPVLGLAAGTWVLPDGPLIAALLGTAVCLVRALRGKPSSWGWWLGLGGCFGLALCSKYIAVLTGAGIGIYLTTDPVARRWLLRPQPYVAALLALSLFAPVLAWNAAHHWVSLSFQGHRADGGKWHPFGPLTTLAGEALFMLPWIWIPLAVLTWRAVRRGRSDRRGWLLACLALPPVVFFEVLSPRAHILFHWAAPGTMLAFPLLGDMIARVRRSSRTVRLALVATAVTVPLGALVVSSEVRFNWLPDIVEDFALGNDPDLAAVDWTSLRTALGQRGDLRPGVTVAATRWVDAGKIDYALGGKVPVICLGRDPREYGLADPAAAHVGQDLLIVSPKETLASLNERFGMAFDGIEELAPVLLRHAGRPAMLLHVFRARGLRATG